MQLQGSVIGQINRRKGLIVNSETQDGYVIVEVLCGQKDTFIEAMCISGQLRLMVGF